MSDNGDCFSSIDSDLPNLAEKEESETYFGKDGEAFDANNVFTAQDFDGTAPFEEMKKKMVALTENCMIYKINLKTNPENKKVVLPNKCSVTIHYELRIEGQDEPFDSTFVRGVPEKFKLDSINNDSLLPGIEIGLRTMKLGDTTVFLIAPEYAFGEHGFPPRIPKNREILAVVKLFSFVPEGEAERLLEMEYSVRSCLPLSEVLNAVKAEHQTGNEKFKEEKFEQALNNYSFAIKLIKERKDERTAEMESIEEKLYLNKAYCFLEMDKPQKAIDFCQVAIDLNDKSVKAYYRMGKAYLELKMLNEAREAFSTANDLMPSEPFILQEIIKLDKQLKENNMADVALCKKMFKSVNISDKEKDDTFKETEIFKSLEDFKIDPDCKELVLPFNQFQGKLNLLEDSANELDLNIRFSNTSREAGQRIYISKKKA